MQNLKIGQSVEVVATTEMVWDAENNRTVVRVLFKPFRAVITGQRRKQVGIGSRAGSSGYHDGYDPGYLQVSETLLLWECRIGMRNKPILVADSDLVAIEEFDLPASCGLPHRSWSRV